MQCSVLTRVGRRLVSPGNNHDQNSRGRKTGTFLFSIVDLVQASMSGLALAMSYREVASRCNSCAAGTILAVAVVQIQFRELSRISTVL